MAAHPKPTDVQVVPLSKLKLLPRNRRKHGERNLAEIEASLLEHDQVEPLLVQKSTGCIIAGNGRFAVMAKLGYKTAEVRYLDVDDAKASQLAIRLNRTGELAQWDDELRAEIDKLCEEGLSCEALGFQLEEVPGRYVPDERGAKLINQRVQEPPAMTWILVGVPTIRFGEFADQVKQLAETPGVLCEMSVGRALDQD